jgi:hypothetical protein
MYSCHLVLSEKSLKHFSKTVPMLTYMASGSGNLGFSNQHNKDNFLRTITWSLMYNLSFISTTTCTPSESILHFFSFFIGFHVILCQAGAESCFFPTDEKTNFLKHHGLLLYVHCHQWTTFWENICYIFPKDQSSYLKICQGVAAILVFK